MQAQQPQQSSRTCLLYQQLLTKLHSQQSTPTFIPPTKELPEYFKVHLQADIYKINNKLKIIMDNDFAQALLNLFKKAVASYHNVHDFAKLESWIAFLGFVVNVVADVKFITERWRKKVMGEIQAMRKSKEYRLSNSLRKLEKSFDQNDFREQFLSNLGYQDIQNQQQIFKIYQTFYKESLKTLNKNLFIKIDSIFSKYQNKKQALGKELTNQIDQYFGQHIGKTDFELKINQELLKLAEEESLGSNQEHLQFLEECYEEIRKILNKFSAMRLFSENLKIKLYLAKFGSIISGFATRNTDMDLTILTNCYIDQIQLLQYLQSYLKAESKQKKNVKYQVRFIKNARIPLLKLKMQTNKGVTSIDLIVNNILGCINSKFLAVYGSIPWIRHLGVLIKLWAKKSDLVQEQKFSSYSLNLMLLHFLMETGRIKLIMDARQRDNQKSPHFIYRRKVKEDMQQFPVYYEFKTKPEDVTDLKRVNIYEVLLQFFVYYSEEGKHWKFSKEESIITVDGSKMKEFEENYIFTIRDPFDLKHNPGRVPKNLENMVKSQLDSAEKVLQSQNQQQILSLFQPR